MFSVVVADDQQVTAEVLTALLDSDVGFRAFSPVWTAARLCDVLDSEDVDVVIMSATFAAFWNASAQTSRSRSHSPHLLIVATETHVPAVVQALRGGVSGWVTEGAGGDELILAVHTVARGEVYVPASILTAVVRHLAEVDDQGTSHIGKISSLTPREREVLSCMVAGMNRQQISQRMFLSPNTVRTHLQNMLRKLGVHSSLAAVAYARRSGITGPGVPLQRSGDLAVMTQR